MEIVIKPTRWLKIDLKELWLFRELFLIFAWRDIKVRYKQTAIGALWAILQPFIMMIVFSVFFGRVAGISSQGIPYPIFSFVGLLFWNFFSNSLSGASDSLVANKSIIQKIYFPRVIVPVSSTLVFLLDFCFAFLILLGLMVYYHYVPSLVGILMIIPCLFVSFLSATGLGFFFSSVNVKYRDVRYVLPFFIQLLIFVTPVIYSTSALGKYQWLWYLNPMSGVISFMRATLLGAQSADWSLFFGSTITGLLLFFGGLLYFKKTEKDFADIA